MKIWQDMGNTGEKKEQNRKCESHVSNIGVPKTRQKRGGGGHWKGLSLFRSRFMAGCFQGFFHLLELSQRLRFIESDLCFFSMRSDPFFFSACFIPIFDCDLHGFESLFRRCLLVKKPPVFKKMGRIKFHQHPTCNLAIHQSINQSIHQPTNESTNYTP